MATSSVMQSIVASPLTRGTNRSASGSSSSYPPQFVVPSYRLRPRLNKIAVRCTACWKEEESKTAATPTPAAKVSTKFSDVLAFSGPAPERINGRLAMIGFISAMAVELSSGQDVLSQISNGGVSLFLGTSAVLTLASLVPLFKGVSVQSKSEGIMTSDAELWNGRFAMLGLVALAFTEYVKGSALV